MELLFKMIVISMLLSSCSANTAGGRHTIGSPTEQVNATSMQMYELDGKTTFFSYDDQAKRINFVDPQEESLQFSPKLSGDKHYLAATKADGITFDVAENVVRLYEPGFQSAKQVLRLAGTIQGSALDFKEGYAAFVDEFFSIGLLQFSASGEIISTWTGGPIIDGLNSVMGGEVLPGGKLVLVVNNGSLVVVDLAATLAGKAWTFRSYDLNLKTPQWVGRIEDHGDRALILDSIGMHLLDLTQGTIIQTINAKANLKLSKNGHHHAYFLDLSSQELNIILAKGSDAIQEVHLKLLDQRPIQTYLTADNIVVATASNEILKMRLSDGLAISKSKFPTQARFGLSEDYAVAMYASALGFIEIVNLESGERKTFEGFNLKAL